MFLTDSELLDLLEGDDPVITGVELGDGEARYSLGAAAQPCSLDLRIGEVLVPGREEGTRGSPASPSDGEILKTGQTAVVKTLEECVFPSDIGAIGFPPNSVSSEGILMTNPGHVDPGYRGSMSFTVINMGSQDYMLSRGKKIVTLLLFRLDKPAHRDLAERGGAGGSADVLAALSPDFLSISARVKAAANTEEAETRRQALKAQVWMAFAAIVATIFVLIGGSLTLTLSDISDLKAKVDSIGDARALKRQVRVQKRVWVRKRAADRPGRSESQGSESP